jgi:hypothetical protein
MLLSTLRAWILPALLAVSAPAQAKEPQVWMTVGEHRFAIALADTAAARAFAAQLPLTLDMDDLNANEKHTTLPRALPADDRRPGTLRNGDLMLYGKQTLVLFYVSFESPYAYTRLGRVGDPSPLPRALGAGKVRIEFSLNQPPWRRSSPVKADGVAPFTCRMAGHCPFLTGARRCLRTIGCFASFDIEDEASVALLAVRHPLDDDCH